MPKTADIHMLYMLIDSDTGLPDNTYVHFPEPQCLMANTGYISKTSVLRKAANALDCQATCQNEPGCLHFRHDLVSGECHLISDSTVTIQDNAGYNIISGPADCGTYSFVGR